MPPTAWIVASLAALNELPQHRWLLERAVACFQDDDRVLGLVLGGSLARGGADFYSDVDLYVVVRDESFDAAFAERDAVARAIGSPLFSFTVEPVPDGSRDYIVTYPGPIKLDLMYHRESEMEPGLKWDGRPVLKDDSGFLATVVSRSAGSRPSRPDPEDLVELEQKFWTWCWYAFGKISRGELWEALDRLHAIRSLALLPLLDLSAERPHEGYRRLERKLGPEMATRLAATVGTLLPEPLYAALQAEISLYRELRVIVFERYRLAFDPKPGEAIESEINRRWAAGRS
ncbi:MAG: aminoglycoside 6-adenylyltransferase [Rubrobacter sp.]